MKSRIKTLKNILEENFLIIFLTPVIVNTVVNILSENNLNYLSTNLIIKFGSISLTALFYISLADSIISASKINFRSYSLVLFFSSYFLLDTIFLPITKNLSSKEVFLIVSFFWLSFLAIKSDKKKLMPAIILYFLMRIYNFINFTEISTKKNFIELNTDVSVQWFPLAKLIYENNLYYTIENNLIEGQTLFGSYLQSTMLKINFYLPKFEFINVNSNIILIFALFLIFDLPIKTKNKYISSIGLTSLVLNNDWLFYLMGNSLMLEGTVSLFIASYFLIVNQYIDKRTVNSKVYFLFFGTMALTKQFVSITFLIFCIFAIIFFQNRKSVSFALIPYIFHYFYQYFYFRNLNQFTYTNDLNFKDLILDLIFFRDLQLSNVPKILSNLFIDKPITLMFIYFLGVTLVILFKKSTNNFYDITIISYLNLNFLFVFILYISYWKNIEIQSSYRYFMNMFYLMYSFLVIKLDSFERIKKS